MPFDIKDMENGLKTVSNIPIAVVGENWQAAIGGTKTVTSEDLQAAIDALTDPAIKTPRVKLGHLDPRFTPDTPTPDGDIFDGTPVLGRFENLQLGDKGMTLYADAVGVPEWFANIMPFAYPNRSVEGGWNVKTPTGQEHQFVITAVSLLGDEYPAMETLEDLQILFSKDGPDWAAELETEYMAASRGGTSMPADRRIAASVSVEDVRRSFFEDFATADNGRWDWWTRAIYMSPSLVIATDFDDNLYACPFSIGSDDAIEWGEPAEVFTQYVETDSGKIAAAKVLSQPAVATFSKETGSRPETTNKEDKMGRVNMAIDVGVLRTRLGLTEEQLPDDASEEQINEALAAPAPGSSPDPNNSGSSAPEQPEPGTPAAGAPMPGEPSEGGAGAGRSATTGPLVQEGQADFSRVDKETLAQLQADAAAGREARAEQIAARQQGKVENAIKAGKIPPARREHYRTLMKTDEEGTTALLDGLEAGVLPVTDEAGSDNSQLSEELSGSEYPDEWLSDVERDRIAAAREGKRGVSRVVSEVS